MVFFLDKHFFLIGLALATLLVGEVNPNERMIFLGLPLNTFMIVMLMAVSLSSSNTVRSLRFVGLPYLLISVSVIYGLGLSQSLEYGLYKAGNLCVVTLVVFIIFHYFYENGRQDYLWKIVIMLILVYLLFALFYKIKNGFWDRQVLFLMNGPIIFSRLMGMAAILVILFTRGPMRFTLFSVFFMGVLWPSSKGPLLSLLLTLALMMIAHDRLITLSIITILVVTPVLLAPEQTVDFIRMLDGTGRLATPLESAILGSELSEAHTATYGSRASAFDKTVSVILQHPAGVGLGDWQVHTREVIEYPHNFFLEVFSEFGLIFGFLFLFPYIWPLIKPKNKLLWVTVFFCINQQVSGDLLDSRYWLIFGILSCLHTGKKELDLFRFLLPRNQTYK